jgi:hypothetical protein
MIPSATTPACGTRSNRRESFFRDFTPGCSAMIAEHDVPPFPIYDDARAKRSARGAGRA